MKKEKILPILFFCVYFNLGFISIVDRRASTIGERKSTMFETKFDSLKHKISSFKLNLIHRPWRNHI